MAAFVRDFGAEVVGGCCGTTPEHIRAARRGRARVERRARAPARVAAGRRVSACAPIALRPATREPMIVGERVNTQGSRRVKELMLAEDYDGVLRVAREQVEYGAHALDVCVARHRAQRRGRADDARSSSGSAMGVEAPLMIDTLELPALSRRARDLPRPRDHQLHQHGERPRPHRGRTCRSRSSTAPRVVALTIDEAGMAKTREREAARRARRSTTSASDEYGLRAEDLIFDALTFTLATGDEEWIDSAVETIEGIRLIKRELPGVLTSLGVSNVSFGLSPRARAPSLNSVFLHHCRRGRPRPGDGQPDAHHGRTWRSRPRSASSPTTWSSTAGRTRCRA